MADIKYKKGELLFSGDITTDSQGGPYQAGSYSNVPALNQNKLIVEFDGVEYTCRANGIDPYTYGAYSAQGVDFTNYPFGFRIMPDSADYRLDLYTQNSGTYNIKIYEAVPDISNMTFKKGELLLNETFETSKPNEHYPHTMAQKSVSTNITENIVIIDFSGVEYTCIRTVPPTGEGTIYGRFTDQGPDFTEYPFIFGFMEQEGQYEIMLGTPNPGTYTVKIYAAIEDTDSTLLSPADFIIAYLMNSPHNSNWNVLSSLLGDGDWSRLKAYVETTPKNMNRQVLRALLEENEN